MVHEPQDPLKSSEEQAKGVLLLKSGLIRLHTVLASWRKQSQIRYVYL
jgi:hypothetical protein